MCVYVCVCVCTIGCVEKSVCVCLSAALNIVQRPSRASVPFLCNEPSTNHRPREKEREREREIPKTRNANPRNTIFRFFQLGRLAVLPSFTGFPSFLLIVEDRVNQVSTRTCGPSNKKKAPFDKSIRSRNPVLPRGLMPKNHELFFFLDCAQTRSYPIG